jgi:hypothetical protein
VRSSRFALVALAAPVLATGCSFSPGPYIDNGDGGLNDADRVFMDARPDAPPNSVCYGRGLVNVCVMIGSEPTNTYQPTNTPISTDTASNCDRVVMQGNGPELCVKLARTITIDRYIRFTGVRPIVLIAAQSLTVTAVGELDVSFGAGSNTGACTGPDNGRDDTGNGASNGASGAGGGGFGTSGGTGGAGDGRAGGAGGQSVPVTYVRGGCRGGRGGRSSAGAGGIGGSSGGGVYLVAGQTITIAGEIHASGEGGEGGPNKAGGGGGGSGGLIGLDAPMVMVNGELVANGGGGGEGGGGGNRGDNGEDGGDWDEIPNGGSGNSNGGNGGNGAYATTAATNGGDVGNGGGGGGGGHGRIIVFATTNTLSSTISPTPAVTTLP